MTVRFGAAASGIPQDLIARNPHDLVPLLGQIVVAALIMLAAFVGLMMLTVDLNEQLQGHVAEGNGVRRDWVFTTKISISIGAGVRFADADLNGSPHVCRQAH